MVGRRLINWRFICDHTPAARVKRKDFDEVVPLKHRTQRQAHDAHTGRVRPILVLVFILEDQISALATFNPLARTVVQVRVISDSQASRGLE